MEPSDRLEALKRMPLLAGLPHGDLEHMAKNVEVQQFAPGTELIKEGTSGATAYFIVSGQCEVRRRLGAASTRLAFLGPGEFFGELSIVDPAPRTATVIATEPVVALTLSGYHFRAALQSNLAMALHLVKVLAVRLRALEDEFAPTFRKMPAPRD